MLSYHNCYSSPMYLYLNIYCVVRNVLSILNT